VKKIVLRVYDALRSINISMARYIYYLCLSSDMEFSEKYQLKEEAGYSIKYHLGSFKKQ
jgi:hypothetical protein